MPPPFQRPAPAPRGHQHRSTWTGAATIRLRRPVRAMTASVALAALLAALTFTAPAALARPAEPGPAVPVPGPSARPPTTRPVTGPPSVLEGRFGFFEAWLSAHEPPAQTAANGLS